jgi:hypothetical protein
MREMRSLVVVAAMAGTAGASDATVSVTGLVLDTHSRWTEDGSRIVTEARVETDDGGVVVSQLGGSVDGLAMRTFPGPPPLVAGMHVAIAARRDRDLSRREHLVVDGVRVLATPPGYVRTGPTQAGNYLYWESGCVFIVVDAQGTRQVVGDQEFVVVDQVLATWNDRTAACSYLRLHNDGRRDLEVGRDYVNLIKFRDTTWCRPATKDDPARCHAESAAGITTTTYVDDPRSPRDGAIVDSDIELNGRHFAISVDGQTLGTASCLADLRNTLTHELGHLLGLEHTCLAAGDPPRVDHLGRPVPLCSQTTAPEIVDATMYNFQECGETSKATLEADDIAGICGIYPKSDDPGRCERVGDQGGCCSAAERPAGTILVWLLVACALLRRRRGLRTWRPRA